MTAMEASQRAVMFMIETLNGGPLRKKKMRNRGAARRAKIKARHDRAFADSIARLKSARALALAHETNKMVEAARMDHA
jgi:hypothetical protein